MYLLFMLSHTSTAVLTFVVYVQQRRNSVILESRSLLVEATITTCFSDQTMDERSPVHQSSDMIRRVVRCYGIGVGKIPLHTGGRSSTIHHTK